MKIIHLKVLGLCLLILSVLVLGLSVGARTWFSGVLSETHMRKTREIAEAAAPALELGVLTADPYFLEEPMERILKQTSAEYLAVYTVRGVRISVLPQDRELSPLSEDFARTLIDRGKATAFRKEKGTDLYIPVWGRNPLEGTLDERRIFFPRKQAAPKEGAEPGQHRILGIARLGIPDPEAPVISWPAGRNRIYFVLTLGAAALLLYPALWWILYRRYEPIHHGVTQLSRGNYAHRVPKQRGAERSELAEGINALARKLEQLNTRLEELAADPSGAGRPSWPRDRALHMAEELASPAGFLFMNLYKLLEYTTNLLRVLNAYNNIKLNSHEAQDIEELKQDTEYEYIIEDVERLVRSCIKAIDKIKKVSNDLKELSSAGDTPARHP